MTTGRPFIPMFARGFVVSRGIRAFFEHSQDAQRRFNLRHGLGRRERIRELGSPLSAPFSALALASPASLTSDSSSRLVPCTLGLPQTSLRRLFSGLPASSSHSPGPFSVGDGASP